MSTKENASTGQVHENCPKAGELIKQVFNAYSNDNIQEALDGLLCMPVESHEFSELEGFARNNMVNFVLTVKNHFAKAAVINDIMKGGKDAAH